MCQTLPAGADPEQKSFPAPRCGVGGARGAPPRARFGRGKCDLPPRGTALHPQWPHIVPLVLQLGRVDKHVVRRKERTASISPAKPLCLPAEADAVGSTGTDPGAEGESDRVDEDSDRFIGTEDKKKNNCGV